MIMERNHLINYDIFVPDDREPAFEQLGKLHKKLHIPIPQSFLETQIWDRDGNTIHHAQRRTQSWNRNAYNIALCTFAVKDADDNAFSGGNLGLKNTSGTIGYGNAIPLVVLNQGTTSADSAGNGVLAASANANFGILVGDDNTAVTFEDYVLGSKIAHGEGAGQLSHTAMQAHDESYVSGTKTYTITHARYFNNNESGEGAISVEEACLVTYGYTTAGANYFLLSRDLTGSLSVPYQGQLKVSYAISLVYSA